MLQLYSSEEMDVLSIKAREIKDSPPHSSAYKELVEVITRAMAKLNIDWLAKSQKAHQKSKLDKCFLPSRAWPPSQAFSFFSGSPH